MTLFGWDCDIWKRAFAWAGEDCVSAISMMDRQTWPTFLAVRLKWLKAGGPFEGPTRLEL